MKWPWKIIGVKNLDRQCRARVLPAPNTFLMWVAPGFVHVPSSGSSCILHRDSRVKRVSILMPLIMLAHDSTSWPHTYSAITRERLLNEGQRG